VEDERHHALEVATRVAQDHPQHAADVLYVYVAYLRTRAETRDDVIVDPLLVDLDRPWRAFAERAELRG
jgi:hypothetical protein